MLLLDQNLSNKIVLALQVAFPGTVHVKHLGLAQKSDEQIWAYALSKNLTIVTNDDDFENLSEYRGFPPKIIHLVRGNLSRQQMLSTLLDNADQLRSFIQSETEGYLALS